MNTNAITSKPTDEKLEKHKVVSREEWLDARKKLLKKEKEATRLGDQLSAERRNLPWVKVEKNYLFDGPSGKMTLADLFAGRRQLFMQHFMFGPDWEEGCPSCSFMADHVDPSLPHLAARDISVATVSRAPLAKIESFKKRMGWKFNWVSSEGSDFNADFRVYFSPEEIAKGKVNYNYSLQEMDHGEWPGLSVFYKNAAGEVFHTYSMYGRGVELLMGAYRIMDLTPKGRDEERMEFSMAWLRHHDRYESNKFAAADKPYWSKSAAAPSSTCGCSEEKSV